MDAPGGTLVLCGGGTDAVCDLGGMTGDLAEDESCTVCAGCSIGVFLTSVALVEAGFARSCGAAATVELLAEATKGGISARCI